MRQVLAELKIELEAQGKKYIIEDSDYAHLINAMKIDELSMTCNMFKYLFDPRNVNANVIAGLRSNPDDLTKFFNNKDLKESDFKIYKDTIINKIKKNIYDIKNNND